MMSRRLGTLSATALLILLLLPVAPAHAQPSSGAAAAVAEPQQTPPGDTASAADEGQASGRKGKKAPFAEDGPVDTTWSAQLESLLHALVRLPLAAALSALLAFRPRRRGTPKRQASVIQTQIILAIVGAMVMLVVGASLARAFGIVGAAGLIRYRAKIDDPKDAGVMLSTLAIGLASGVGLYLFAGFATVFVLGVLAAVESIEPQPYLLFDLAISVKDSAHLKESFEDVLRRRQIPFELRSTSAEEICYEVKLPLDTHTDTVSNALVSVDPARSVNVKWAQKKEAK